MKPVDVDLDVDVDRVVDVNGDVALDPTVDDFFILLATVLNRGRIGGYAEFSTS